MESLLPLLPMLEGLLVGSGYANTAAILRCRPWRALAGDLPRPCATQRIFCRMAWPGGNSGGQTAGAGEGLSGDSSGRFYHPRRLGRRKRGPHQRHSNGDERLLRVDLSGSIVAPASGRKRPQTRRLGRRGRTAGWGGYLPLATRGSRRPLPDPTMDLRLSFPGSERESWDAPGTAIEANFHRLIELSHRPRSSIRLRLSLPASCRFTGLWHGDEHDEECC